MTTTHAIAIGTPVPDFSLPRLDGSPWRLSELRGKRVALFMWGSW
ncbi:MAG: redoxin domain-containing protein [Chloroflexi bacterium]|nr:redoxin domain-containing protein [Chloroflexota bacterium]